ncbi:hypothetical protein BCR33DRAFT_857498 [Rhizoclosmatium globosum]|uniref:Enoyl reductase (ER) domain-containing protein n=1 Tax=Rhizoclosmatium globosum TaxID=329046 RepID=A0A1Y2B4X3_9FUNG|nr:hypothetical protein BCR33DRAFT_857498 [Rhizoclosmatium globosum]|eukprot:ORY29879.1 hypothetical protein BCR33DRAFT_857498 [Rhizoclosmatium globosum]
MSLPPTMRAITISGYGSPEVLTESTLPTPTLSNSDTSSVIVKVEAAGVNPVDYKVRQGDMAAVVSLPIPNAVLGIDYAGTVVEVGSAVKGIKVGDRVYGKTAGIKGFGTYAEYVKVSTVVDVVVKRPEGVSAQQAAGVGLKVEENKGKEVLVNGASGGVGIFAVQIAKILGAKVVAVASGKNKDFVTKTLGADDSTCFTMQLEWMKARTGTWHRHFEAGGLFAASAPASHGPVSVGALAGMVGTIAGEPSFPNVAKWIEEGKVKLFTTVELPLSDVKKAHELSASGRTVGKIVLFKGIDTLMEKLTTLPVGYKTFASTAIPDSMQPVIETYAERTRLWSALFADVDPDLILIDFFAEAALDTAAMEGYNFGVLGMVGFKGFLTEWFIPSIMNPVSQETWGSGLLRAVTSADMVRVLGPAVVPVETALNAVKKKVWGQAVPSWQEIAANHLYLSVSHQPAFECESCEIFERIGIYEKRLIYVSFGSGASGFQDIVARLFAGINLVLQNHADVHVLWSCKESYSTAILESQVSPDNRDRIQVLPWLAQRGVLEHSVTKVFITHGGLSSIHESVFGGVPMLLIPLFGDQPLNAIHVQDAGIGVRIKDKLTFVPSEVLDAVDSILNAPPGSARLRYKDERGCSPEFSHDKVQKMKWMARMSSESSLLFAANTIETVARVGVII